MRRATGQEEHLQPPLSISIHALREEGDSPRAREGIEPKNFYPRPPRGGRLNDQLGHIQMLAISIHALREEGDRSQRRQEAHRQPISIHALREEGDSVHDIAVQAVNDFYPRPPRGGRPQSVQLAKLVDFYFYPRPPRGGRPARQTRRFLPQQTFLSTPSARRATYETARRALKWLFLSTPSARRATRPRPPQGHQQAISIHALREEGDSASTAAITICTLFLSTPSARRATRPTRPLSTTRTYFYPRPPRGGRPVALYL